MVKIRLMRVGKRQQPSYRVVVADSRSPRDGRIIEAIGHYNPRTDPSVVEIDAERAVHWLERGAQPSSAVRNLLKITGAWSTFTGEAAPTVAEPQGATSASVRPTRAGSVDEDAPKQDDEVEPAGEDEAS